MAAFLKISLIFLICMLFAPALIAQQQSGSGSGSTQSQSATPSKVPLTSDSSNTLYKIGPRDVLDVKVFNHPEYTSTPAVQSDGTIRVPFFDGTLNVTCKTEQEVQDMVRQTLLTILRRPLVSVTVKEYHSRVVRVVGSVQKPTEYSLQRRARLLDLINSSGGLLPSAGTFVDVVRDPEPQIVCDDPEPVQGEQLAERIDLKRLLSGDPAVNRYVRVGETIEVPEGGKVFITGAVNNPTAITLNTQLSKLRLLGAIALASGTPYDAKKDQVKIQRTSSTGNQETLTFDLNKLQSDPKSDPMLQEGDVVFVPSSAFKRTIKSLSSGLLVNPAIARQVIY